MILKGSDEILLADVAMVQQSEDYVLASILEQCLANWRKHGINTDALSQLVGFDLAEAAANPEGWINIKLLEQMVQQIALFSPDPLLGLHAASMEDMGGFGVLGYLEQTCGTLQEIYDATMRYERLVSDIGTTTLRHEPGVVFCIWHCKTEDPLFRRHATEFILGCWVRHIRFAKLPLSQILKEVHFSHPAPSNPALQADYENYFGCPVRFDQPESAWVVPIEMMTAQLRLPSPSLQLTLERHARLLLSERTKKPSLRERIKAQLRVLLMQGNISRDYLASELGVSSRHLHRQLQKAGSSYSQLVSELRIEMAKILLQDPLLSIEAIAQRLGFSESTPFIRWFRQHFGSTPRQYRQQLKDQDQ